MEYQAAIDTFVAITNADADTATRFLQMGDWNVEQSINLFFASDIGESADSGNEDTRAPIPAKEEQVLDAAEIQELNDSYDDSGKKERKKVVGGGVTITETVKTTVVAKNKKGKSIGAFRNFKDEAEILSEKKKAKRKAEKLNDLFMPPLELLFKGSFEDCKAVAAQANKLVVVNVQDKDEFSSYVLNRDIWSDKRIASLIRLNFVLIQIDRDSPEGKEFGRIYRVTSYPYISIVDGITGECMWSKSISTESPLTQNDFLKTLQSFVDVTNELLSQKYGTEVTHADKAINKRNEEKEEKSGNAMAGVLRFQNEHVFNIFNDDDDDNDKLFSFEEEEDDDDNDNDDDNDDDKGNKDIVHNKNIIDDDDDDIKEINNNNNSNEKDDKIIEEIRVNTKRKAEDSGELGQYQFKIRDFEGKSTNAMFLSSDSVQDIRNYVDTNIKPQAPYKIYLSFPKRLLDDNALISDLHLPVRAVLVLQKN